jgi:DNA-binding FadR family transcriptional regulator
MAGTLEALWSGYEVSWAERQAVSTLPVPERKAALDCHEEIIQLIAAGDSAGVRTVVSHHLETVQSYPTATTPPDALVDPVVLRLQRS